MRTRFFPVLGVFALAVAGCSATSNEPPEVASTTPPSTAPETAYPLVVNNCGTEVTFTEAPERVIAIKSTSIEMMLALGLHDRIIGVGFPDGPFAAEWAPADDLPVISDRVPGLETVLELAPDLIYAGWESNLTADGAGERAALADVGVNTFVSPAACLSDPLPDRLSWNDIWAEIGVAASIFGVLDQGESLVAEQQLQLGAIEPDDRGLTALWYSSGSDTPYVGAGYGNPQLVLDAVGLTNIAADVPENWSSLSWEAVIAADPDVIVLVDSSWGPTERKREQLEGHPATAALTAVREARYLVVPFPAGEAGVRSVEAVQTLSDQLAELTF